MHKFLPLSAALILTLGLSQPSLAQGKGDDKDKGPGKHAGQSSDRNNDDKDKPGKGRDKSEARSDKDRGPDRGARDKDNKPDRVVVARDSDRRGDGDGGNDNRGDDGRDRRDDNRRADRDRGDDNRRNNGGDENRRGDNSDRDDVRRGDRGWNDDRRYRLIAGCPPGLAKRDNGCLPPGQAKKLERPRYEWSRYDWVWNRDTDRTSSYVQRYDEGYLYRYDRQGSLLGYFPALGGALAAGSQWPSQYAYDPAPQYQTQYFGLNQPYDYRYADGAIYGVDPKTQAIQQVVALLTGQPISVGQQMPSGYDIYNVPYAYRDQYADTADNAYRYNDGAVYQVDPTTQVVQAIIQLLT